MPFCCSSLADARLFWQRKIRGRWLRRLRLPLPLPRASLLRRNQRILRLALLIRER